MRPGVTSMILALPCELSVMTPAWLPVKDRASWPEVADRHREQCHRDPLAGGQQHVELAAGGQRGDLLGEVDQLVGGVTHRGDDHHHVVAGPLGVHDPLRDPLDAFGVGHGGAAVLLHDNAHANAFARFGLELPAESIERRSRPPIA